MEAKSSGDFHIQFQDHDENNSGSSSNKKSVEEGVPVGYGSFQHNSAGCGGVLTQFYLRMEETAQGQNR